MTKKFYYSLGLCGYELYQDSSNQENLMVLFIGTQREQIAKSYKVQNRNGRFFVRPYGRRIYLDECI